MKPRLRWTALFAWSLLVAAAVAPVAVVAASNAPRVYVIHPHHAVGTETFALAPDVNIRLGANPNAYLTDLRPGETAHITYAIQNGYWVAHAIAVNPPPATTHASSQATAAPKTSFLRASGTILSYNAATGLLTIRHNR